MARRIAEEVVELQHAQRDGDKPKLVGAGSMTTAPAGCISRMARPRSVRPSGRKRTMPSTPAHPSGCVSVSAEKRSSGAWADRSAEHTTELQSLMRVSYAVFRLPKKDN